MSYSYWGIIGYGVDMDDFYPYMDNQKVNDMVRKLCPETPFDEDVFDDDTFYGGVYSTFTEFLCELDDTNSLTWDDGGNTQKQYFLYSPKYPWAMKNTEPLSPEDVEIRIINVLRKICKDNTTSSELKDTIKEINDYGCG